MIVLISRVFMLSVFVEQWATQAQEHVGCFRSTDPRPILSKPVFIRDQDEETMTIDICIMRCRTEYGTTYAGIRSGFRCRCGDSHQHEENGPQLSDSSCATECPGDPLKNCGGDSSMVIYSVCNQNRYRDITNAMGNCDASCHCTDFQSCTYSNGSCPAGCEPGWSSAVCNVRNFTSVAGDQTLMTDAVDHSASNGMTGADPDGHIDRHTDDNIPVTAIPVGVSLAFICLVVIAALAVHFRYACKSGDSCNEASSISEVPVGAIHPKNDLAKEQTGIVPTCAPSASSPSLNYSQVVYENYSPVHDDGNDIAKSVDNIVIADNNGKLEYEKLKRSTINKHANLKEKSLYEKLRT